MRVTNFLQLILSVAGIFLPVVSSIEEAIAAFRAMRSERAQALASTMEKYNAMDPNADVTVEEIEAELAKLNPPLQFEG